MEKDYKEEFLAVYNAYADALFRHCFFRVYHRDLAKDLVQETFCRTWSYLAQGKKIENIRAFLYRTAHNLIIDVMRKKKPLSLDELTETGFDPQIRSALSLEESLDVKETVKLLNHIEEPYRTAVTMRYIDELKPKEIAEALGLSQDVVSVRIHRGIQKLRELTDTHAL